jgi:Transglutaminase-like superfamily
VCADAEARVRWAVTAVGRRVPLARNCLIQAMVAQALLQRRGFPAHLVIGAARAGAGQLTAHAWVENATGHAVVGGREAGSYTALVRGPAGPS